MESEIVDLFIDGWYYIIPSLLILAVTVNFICFKSPKNNNKENIKDINNKINNNNDNKNKSKKNSKDVKTNNNTKQEQQQQQQTNTTISSPKINAIVSPLIEKTAKAMTINNNEITSMVISGDYLVYSSNERHLKVFNYQSLLEKIPKSYNLALPFDHARKVTMSNDQVIATLEQKLISYSLLKAKNDAGKTYQLKWEVPLQHKSPVITLTTTNNSNYIISLDETIFKLWNKADGSLLTSVSTNQLKNYQAAMSGNGKFCAVATFGSEVKIWEVCNKRDGSFDKCVKAALLTGYKSSIYSLSFNQDGTRIVTGGKDGQIKLWDLDVRYQVQEEPKLLYTISSELPSPPTIMSISPSGHYFAVGCSNLIQIRKTVNGELIDQLSNNNLGGNTASLFSDDHIDWANDEKLIIAGDHQIYILKNF